MNTVTAFVTFTKQQGEGIGALESSPDIPLWNKTTYHLVKMSCWKSVVIIGIIGIQS